MQDTLTSDKYLPSLLKLDEIPKLSSTMEFPGHLLSAMYGLHDNGPATGEVVCRDLKTVAVEMAIEYIEKDMLYEQLKNAEWPEPN